MSKKVKIILGIGIVLLVVGIIAIFLSSNRTYTVTFDTDGGSLIVSQAVKKGDIVTRPTNPTKEGYSFVRWELENKEYDFKTPIDGDVELKAIWEKNVETPKYKLVFTIDNQVKEIEITDISEVLLDELGFEEKDGYEIEWYVNDEKYDFSTPITSDMNITGKYVKVNYVTVKFNSNGGSKVENQKVKTGGKAVEPTDVTKYGYILDGWYLNSKKYDFSTTVTKAITLTAKWNEDPSVKRYTVTFDSDKGSKVASQKVIENETAKEPSNPTKDGYKFVEWQLDGKKYDFKAKVTKDITLKTKWRELEKYTVTFDSVDGSKEDNQIVLEDSLVTKPTNPTKAGYIFKEWQLDGKTFDFTKTKITKNITLKAVYAKKYIVSFDSGVASQEVEDGKTAKEPTTNPTKSGWKFIEWQLDGKKYTFSTPVNQDIHLTAYFEKEEEYTVSFDSKGGSSVASQTVIKGGKATMPSSPTWSGHTFKKWLLNGSEYNFESAVNSDIILTAEWGEKTYKITAESVSNATNMDVILTVWDGNNKVNAKDILLSNGTSMGFTWNTAFYNSTNEFVVVLQDDTRIKATKK